jgi:hypothetical protein
MDIDFKSGFLSAIINFTETIFSTSLIEYFEMVKYIIAFTQDTIFAKDSIEPEPVICYVVLDKEKRGERFVSRIIQPLLSQAMMFFKTLYEGKNLVEISQFKDFRRILHGLFKEISLTVDQKYEEIIGY